MGKLRAAGVDIVRRVSGGGTVFHDPGNLNYSFLMDSALFDKQNNLSLIVSALKRIGIPASANNRGDILVDGRKISGNAMAIKKGRALHHGTLLVHSDLGGLHASISGWQSRIDTRAVASNPFPVMNLADVSPGVTIGTVMDAIRAEFRAAWGAPEVVEDILAVVGHEEADSAAGVYRSWEWTFGSSPRFEAMIPFSPASSEQGYIRLHVEDGRISSAQCAPERDSAAACVIREVLSGMKFDSTVISASCRGWLLRNPPEAVPGGCTNTPDYNRYRLVSALAGIAESEPF